MTSSEHATDVLVRRASIVGSPERIAPGTRIGAWRVGALIAAGGCGAVYAARHVALDRPAALKILHGGLARAPDLVDRFVREARAVHRIGHPNLVDVFDLGTCDDGRPFFAMELLSPGDLETRLAASGPLRLGDALAIVQPIGDALSSAHRCGYIHRDVKASNIGFAGATPKLLDFGVAKLLELGRDAGTCTLRVGTPHCMAPEQIRGEHVDPRTDVYALGVLLHQLVTGRYPFDAATPAEIERQHLEAEPPPVSAFAPVPAALDALVLRALAKRAADRPGSVAELVGELAALLGAAGEEVRDAIAIRAEVAVPDACSDADIDAAARITARALDLLAAGGFTPVIATATSVVAGRIVDGDRQRARRGAEALAASLARALPALTIAITTGPATVAPAAGRFVAGELFEVQPWNS